MQLGLPRGSPYRILLGFCTLNIICFSANPARDGFPFSAGKELRPGCPQDLPEAGIEVLPFSLQQLAPPTRLPQSNTDSLNITH